MNRQMERELEQLEEELSDPDLTEKDRKELRRLRRELLQECADEERWQEEGKERGWRS